MSVDSNKSNNKFYEGVINQVSSNMALCTIPSINKEVKIGGKFLKKSLDGDKVLIKVKDGKYGFVQKVLERNDKILTGQIQFSKGFAFIKPWNTNYYKDFFVDIRDIYNVKDGDVVEFKILDWNKKDRSPNAKVLKSIYNASETQYLMYKMNLPTKFPTNVIEELKNIDLTEEDYKNREDLRHIDTYSIDPKGSSDIDDAISLENLDNGYRVGIHISDVSHFIKPGTSLDKEAFERGFSIYFPNYNIPMLPRKLSSDLCSLVENEDRLAITLFINFNRDWEIIDKNITRSIVKVNKNLTYEKAQENKDNPTSTTFHFLNTMYSVGLKTLSKVFPNIIELNRNEFEWVFDEKNNPIKIKLKTKSECNHLVKSWMLIANKLVTEIVENINPNTPWIYRTHDKIQKEDLEKLKLELVQLGEYWDDNMNQKSNIKRLLSTDNSSIITELLLNKYRPAKYNTLKDKHFSLGVDNYSHFTSPIRRYSDIIIHRILLNNLNNKPIYCANLDRDCVHLTKKQKNIDSIEKKYNSITSLNFVKNIDYSFKAKIIYFNKKGIFVKTEFLVDGWILSKHLEELGIFYSKELKKWINPKYDWMIGNNIKVEIDKLNWSKNELILKMK